MSEAGVACVRSESSETTEGTKIEAKATSIQERKALRRSYGT